MSGIRPSPTVTSLFFPRVLEIARLAFQGEILPSMGLYTRYEGLIERLSMFLWLKRATSTYSHVFENLGKRSVPSDHEAVRFCFFPNRLFGKAFQVGCLNIPSVHSKAA